MIMNENNKLFYSELEERVKQFAQWEKNHPQSTHGQDVSDFKTSAVLIVLFIKDSKLHFLLTKRSQSVRTHKGDTVFPGGKVDPEDKHIVDTALREAEEEVNLPTNAVKVLDVFSPLYMMLNPVEIYPVIATLNEDFDLKSLKPNLEVDAIFDVPVDIFLSNQYYDPFKFQYRGTGQYIDIPRFNWKLSNGETVTIFGITAFICTQVAAVVYDRLPDWEIKMGGYDFRKMYFENKTKANYDGELYVIVSSK